MTVLLFAGCSPGAIGLGDKDRKNDVDTDSTDTDSGDTGETEIDTSVDTDLAVETAATSRLAGTAGESAGLSLDKFDPGDVRDHLLIGAPGAGGTQPGMVYMMPAPVRSDMLLAEAEVRFVGLYPGDRTGIAVAHADFNADGDTDAAIGGGAEDASGFACVVNGPFIDAAATSIDVPLSFSTVLTYDRVGDAFGTALAVGKYNGDDIMDLAVGAPRSGLHQEGDVTLYAGGTGGIAIDSFASFFAATDGALFGTALVAGDVDSDGIDDLLIGAPAAEGDEAAAGAVYLFLGPMAGDRGVNTADAVWKGEHAGDRAGASLALADLNGDGMLDVLIGAPGSDRPESNAGAAYVVYGPLAGTASLAAADAVLVGGQPGSEAGTSVAYAYDMNSDGVRDVLVGAPLFDEDGAPDIGRAYIALGPFAGWSPLAEVRYVRGSSSGGQFGRVVFGNTEVTGDSLADAVVAAPFSNAGGTTAGEIVLIGGF